MSKTRILIVEDEAIIARDISLQLARTGYERVGVTPRGEEAIELAGRLRPDLVLMDIQLAGEMDGIVAATQIRKQFQIPVVFLTAFADEAVLLRARQAEPFGYIVKPFEERELQPTIEIALHKHRTEAVLRRSEERFRRLFNGVRDALLLADTESGQIIECNEEACRLFGRPHDALVGMHQSELHPPEKADIYRDHFAGHASGSNAAIREAEIVTADGRVVPVEVNAGLVEMADRPAQLGVFRDVSARRAAEHAVRDHQARLDAIFRAVPAGIGVIVRRTITEVNDHVSRLTGYSREELVGQPTHMLYVTEDEHENVGREIRESLRSQGTSTLETRWRCKDGRVIDVLVSLTPIIPGDPAAGVTFSAFDITERKRIRAELARRNRILEGMQRISHIMLEPTTDADAFQRLADEIAAMLEVRFAAILLHDPGARVLQIAGLHGMPNSGRIPRELPVRNTLAGLVLERGTAVVEHDVQSLMDQLAPEVRPFEPKVFAGVPLVASGKVSGVLAVAHDQAPPLDSFLVDQLTSVGTQIASLIERRESRAARLRTETELLAIYDHAPVIICLLDEKARIIRVNQSAARFAGRAPSDLNGASAGEFLNCLGSLDDSRGCGFGPQCATCLLRKTVLDTLETGASHAQVEVQRSVPHGSGTRELSMLLSTARIDLDGRQRILVVLEDITENRRLTEQLMRAQRMESIGTLASGIAHDLNNVLAPIVMSLGMLREAVRDPMSAELISTMNLAAQRGADIVRQVLTFARGLGGERVEIQPKHVINEIARIIRETFPRSIELSCDYGRDLPTILGDPTQIQQVLMNLSLNARDAMPRGGQLIIRVGAADQLPQDALPVPKEPRGRFVVFTVRDTGTGMPPAVLDRIFDPFFTTKPVGKGTGLGLAVTLGIVERHGGAISVASTPGVGTTFEVYLPAADAIPANEPIAPVEEPLPQGNGEIILVVDDEPSVRTVIAGMLSKSGYTPVIARDGSEALIRLDEHGDAVRLVLTDLMMAGMDGLEFIPKVRQLRRDLPIIAMTGIGDDDVRALAREAGANQVLTKPFSNTTLLWTAYALLQIARPGK